MNKRLNRKEKINFLLENKHYKRLQLYLYLLSVSVIVAIYFLVILLFSNYYNFLITGIISLLIGLFLVYKRDELVKKISDHIENKKRKKLKEENKKGLKTTIKRIVPKQNRNIKFKVGGRDALKDKVKNLKFKLKITKKNNKKQKDYIEIK